MAAAWQLPHSGPSRFLKFYRHLPGRGIRPRPAALTLLLEYRPWYVFICRRQVRFAQVAAPLA